MTCRRAARAPARRARAQVVANIVLPNTYYLEPRLQQLDLRFSRMFRLRGGGTIQPQVDFFNVLNANSVLGSPRGWGPATTSPASVLDPRVVKFGVNMNF